MSILFQESLFVIIVLSGVPLLASACSGFCISLLQAVTQIQEQTITYAVKVITLIVVIALCSDWAIVVVKDFSTRIFESIGTIGI